MPETPTSLAGSSLKLGHNTSKLCLPSSIYRHRSHIAVAQPALPVRRVKVKVPFRCIPPIFPPFPDFSLFSPIFLLFFPIFGKIFPVRVHHWYHGLSRSKQEQTSYKSHSLENDPQLSLILMHIHLDHNKVQVQIHIPGRFMDKVSPPWRHGASMQGDTISSSQKQIPTSTVFTPGPSSSGSSCHSQQ